MEEFSNSQWFRRGWTLQELIAPSNVIFVSRNWEEIGSKSSFAPSIERITGIDRGVLLTNYQEEISVAKRMSWATGRQTTRGEDRAYSLLGLFGVYMPTIYGEGENAFIRLQIEIMKSSNDQSIFAWKSHQVWSTCFLPGRLRRVRRRRQDSLRFIHKYFFKLSPIHQTSVFGDESRGRYLPTCQAYARKLLSGGLELLPSTNTKHPSNWLTPPSSQRPDGTVSQVTAQHS